MCSCSVQAIILLTRFVVMGLGVYLWLPGASQMGPSGSGSGHGDPVLAFTYGKLFHLLMGNCFTYLWEIVSNFRSDADQRFHERCELVLKPGYY